MCKVTDREVRTKDKACVLHKISGSEVLNRDATATNYNQFHGKCSMWFQRS